MMLRWSLAVGFALAALTPSVASAKKTVETKGKELRVAQVAEIGVERKPARVLTTFSLPGQSGSFAVVCAREARPDTAAFCAVLDDKGKVIDDSLGLNVLRAEDKKKGDHLELLFKAQFGKELVYISSDAALTPENLDAIGNAFQADLSMLEFMTGLDAFPIGVGLEGGTKVVGDQLVLGKAATTPLADILAEFKAPPAPEPEPEPEPEAAPEAPAEEGVQHQAPPPTR